MRWLTLLLLLLLLPLAAEAQQVPNPMAEDGSNAKLPEARYNIGSGNICNPVSDFGADPTGAADASTAINSCAALTKNGQRVNVYLPAGTYYLANQITIGGGQMLFGDGRTTTTLTVNQNFSPSATGVINLGASGDSGPEIRDLGIVFQQPSTQGVRANFADLGTCTSTEGGTGCKYPPAIKCLSASGRFKASGLRITRAWKGISITGAGSCLPWLDNIEMSSLDTGLEFTGQVLDFNHIKGFHFWAFDINSATPLYTGVYSDGSNFAAKFGEFNGLTATDFAIFKGRIQINSPGFWGQFSNIEMDGNNATLEVQDAMFAQFANIYATGLATGANTSCQVNVSGGSAMFANAWLSPSGTAAHNSGLCISGGRAQLTGGQIVSANGTARAVKQTGGRLRVIGTSFQANTGVAYTVPLVDQTAGILTAVGNTFPVETTAANVGSISIATDNELNFIANNNSKTWKVVLGFSTLQGYYDLDQTFVITNTITPAFATNGDFVPATPTSAGTYFLRGNHVEFTFQAAFGTNAYTTAASDFRLVTPMPPPTTADNPQQGCALSLISNLTAASMPGCAVTATGGSATALLQFWAPVSAAAGAFYTTTQVPASKAGIQFRGSGRYRAR